MIAELSDRPPAGGWTVADLDAMPEDGVRRELIDGVLHAEHGQGAQAGALREGRRPHYWLIETDDDITVHTNRLNGDAGVYEPSGSFTDVIRTDDPWTIEIPIAGIRPRNF